MLFAMSLLLPPVLTYEPPYVIPPETEIAVKIEDDWHHTTHNWSYCEDLYDDGWFKPYEIQAPAVCTTFTAEIWFLEAVDLYAYEFRLVWDWCWLELQSWTVFDLGEGGLTGASDIYDADDTTPEVEPIYVQVWTFLNPVDEGVNGTIKVAELTFHVIQDPTYPDVFYSALYIVSAVASTSCGEEICLSKEHGVVKLLSTPPIVLKELDKNITWVVGDEIVLDINIYNATKLKSFEFLLNIPEWLEVDLQKDAVVIGDFLPPPYEEYIIVRGPSANFPFVCEQQLWIKIIRDCDKPPVSGDGTLATITFTVMNPFELMGKMGPDYWQDCTTEHHPWIPFNVTDEICFKEAQGPEYMFYEDHVWLDGIRCYQDPTHEDACGNPIALLAPPFGPECKQMFYWDVYPVPKETICFKPIPGDLNLDGHVGLLDMMMGLPFFGVWRQDKTPTLWDPVPCTSPLTGWFGDAAWPMYEGHGGAPDNYDYAYMNGPVVAFLDLEEAAEDIGLEDIVGPPAISKEFQAEMLFEAGDIVEDGQIDLFDLVAMAKNWCRTEP
jgi:hypothetical protein